MATAKEIDAIQDQKLQQEEYDNLIRNIVGYAGGGIAKIAGIDQGPQRTSMNPDSGGLKGILKRAMKIKE